MKCIYRKQGSPWGKRRYQNDDGTLTEEGKKRYFGNEAKDAEQPEAVELKCSDILASLEEDIELLGDSVEERKTKGDISNLLKERETDDIDFIHVYGFRPKCGANMTSYTGKLTHEGR